MILIVDDEPDVLELISSILARASHQTKAFHRAEDALDWLESNNATLILSDVSMPDMNGFDFKREFARRFPNKNVPFLFLSSHSDPEHIVRGLELGADDYLLKPAHPEVLRAKIESVLRRKRRYAVPIFHGDIALFPFVKLLQFCETRGLTGEVAVQSGSFSASVYFNKGELVYDDSTEDVLDTLVDLDTGSFRIHAQPLTFDEIQFASTVGAAETAPGAPPPESNAMGQLSGVKVGTRTFQIQTELVSHPEQRIVTIVILDGRTVLKRVSDLPPLGEKSDHAALIRAQHRAVEAEVRQKLGELGGRQASASDSPKERFNRLFERGHDAYLDGDLEQARHLWQQAQAIDPTNKALAVNLEILGKKLDTR